MFNKKRQVYILSENGKKKAESDNPNMSRWLVIASLKENRASTIDDIAKDTGLSDSRIKEILHYLIENGDVEAVKGDKS